MKPYSKTNSTLTGIILGLFVLMAASGVYAQNIDIEDVPEFKPGEPHPIESYMQKLRDMHNIYGAPETIDPRQTKSTFEEDPTAMDRAGEVIFSANEEDDPDSLIAHAYLQFWTATQKSTPGMALSVAAWQNTSSWGNFGMQDMGTVPRVPLPTDRDYRYISVMIQPWISGYAAINMAEEVLIAIEDGETITDSNGEDVTDRAKAFAHFVQGITYGFLAQLYEGGFIYEAGDRNFEDVNFVGYEGLKDEAITRLEEARNLATFSGEIPFEWMPVIESNLEDYDGGEIAMNSDRFERVVNSYEVWTRVLTARGEAERDAIDWNRVGELAADGIEEHLVLEADPDKGWWDYLSGSNNAISQDPLWTRAAYPTIGKYDESGNYQNWLNEDWADRTEMTIETPDARVMAQSDGTPDPVSRGLYFAHVGPSFFDPGRGTYFLSEYNHIRWEVSYQQGVADMHHMLTAEVDLYRAEAELRADNHAEAAGLINNTREEIGELEPADAEDGFDELMEMINYERRIELMNTASGIGFFDMRSQDLLTEGTQKQFPLDPMVAPPVMTSPQINSFDNPTDLTLEVGYPEEAFAYQIIPDDVTFRVATDPGFDNVVFEEEHTTDQSFDLSGVLEDDEVYYVHVTSFKDIDNETYTSDEVYAFATVGLESTNIATIRQEITEDEQLRALATIEGTLISPFFNDSTWAVVDDGTGGLHIWHFEYGVPEDLLEDAEPGDGVNVYGELDNVIDLPSFYIRMLNANMELTGEEGEMPDYVEVDAGAIHDELHETHVRRVEVSEVSLENDWPDEFPGPDAFSNDVGITVRDISSENQFNLVIYRESELWDTRPPLGEFTLKGINGVRPGELTPFFREELVLFEELTPAEGEFVNTSTPELSWSAVNGIDSYNVVVYNDEAATDTLQHHQGLTETSVELDELTEEQIYYWQVHPVGEFDDEQDVVGMGSPVRSFTTDEALSTEEETGIPDEFTLNQNYPNPFNPVTRIGYELPEQAEVTVEVFDILGRRVEILVNEHQQAGRYEVSFDASGLSSGTYIYRIEAGEFVETRQMMLVK